MLELEPADARGVADLHVEVVVVLVIRVDDADAEGLRITEGAEIHAVDVDVAEDLHAAFAAQERVRLEQALRKPAHFFRRIGDGLPEGVLAALEQGHRRGELAQLGVGDGQGDFAAFARQIGAEFFADRIRRLAVGPLELGFASGGVHRQSRFGWALVSSTTTRSGAPGWHSAR